MKSSGTVSKVKRKAAVLGFPVKHSLSPILHSYWLKTYSIEGEYGRLEVKPEELKNILPGLKEQGYVGCNLTLPHKELAVNIVNQVSEKARSIGAVNTVLVREDGSLFGENTDAFGFIENIVQNAPGFDFTKGAAVVLGAGGAARAVLWGLIEKNVPAIILLNRSRDKAEVLKDVFSGKGTQIIVEDWGKKSDVLEKANLLVNTTSLGMSGQPELDISLEKLPKKALVTDIVYAPLETKLLAAAKARGNKTVDGLGMLLYQAVEGFSMWFGVKPEVTPQLRQVVEDQLQGWGK